jgi:hypothetical protein
VPLVVAIYLSDTLVDIESDTSHGVSGLAQRLTPQYARLACWLSVLSAQGLALVFWPADGVPNILFFASLAMLAVAMLAAAANIRQAHWPAIMVSAIALATGWLMAH